ncbi:MAG TPA: hypothetical protein PLM07_16720 [Candidatus Rifleibacterium sp.]|nr:hypothetical protein [Candidatus Rifleibacterium sp.]HPT47528.1 hypothetical protein [Candidatus Rifleibacterium sp.]
MKFYDSLFVINQNNSIENIAEIINQQSFQTVLILSTNHLFSFEKFLLTSLTRCQYDFKIFSDYISDEAMETCDNAATEELQKELPAAGKVQYAQLFMNLSMRNKNRIVLENLRKTCLIGKVFFSSKLGIFPDVWQKNGTWLSKPEKRMILRFNPYSWFKQKLSPQKYFRQMEVHIFERDNEKLFFFCPLKRLEFASDITFEKQIFRPISYLRWPNISFEACIDNFIEKNASPGKESIFCTTIHGYDIRFANVRHPIRIFVDGFHPSNYPRSYIDVYPNATFVTRDLISLRWFKQFGKKVSTDCNYLKLPCFRIPAFDFSLRKVYLLLNHAGDWSALINRSDTDLLIETFARAAAEFSDQKFVIRLHPTMDHVDHEGLNASSRLHAFVAATRLPNLYISQKTLEQDLLDADLIISEYSKTIIDAFSQGKIALICNLTKRRSFMKDYEEFGFPCCESFEQITDFINRAIRTPEAIVTTMRMATSKYNQWLNSSLKS